MKRDVRQSRPVPGKDEDRVLKASVTGGIVQPVRLHYRLTDEQGLLDALQKVEMYRS